MGSEHEINIKDYLEDEGLEDVYAFAPTRDRSQGIFVISRGGPPPGSFMGQDEVLKRPAIQVIVIGEPNDPEGAYDDARAVHDALTNGEPDGYLRTTTRQSAPIPLGEDDEHRFRWSVNALIWIEE